MKIALVQCPAWGRLNPPLALSMLAAYLRNQDKEVALFDLNNELFHKVKPQDRALWHLGSESFWDNKSSVAKFVCDYKALLEDFVNQILQTGTELIGFSIFNSSTELSLFIAEEIKKLAPNKIIIFGGPNCAPHINGTEVIKSSAVDIMVIGEGELVLDQIIDLVEQYGKVDFCKGTWLKKDGQVIDCGSGDLIADPDLLPFADFGDFALSTYAAPYRLPIYLSRGCPNRCVYCNESVFWRGYRYRSGERVFQELKYQTDKHKGVTHFDFSDSLINANLKELLIMADLIIDSGLKITWGGQAVIRPYMTSDVLAKLKQSGCLALGYGVESGSQKVLNLMRKGFTVEGAERVIRDTHKVGIDVVTNFMFGFPGETDEDFEETLKFVAKNKEYISTLNPSLAYTAIGVGTYLHAHPEEYGIDLSAGYLYWRTKDGKNTYEQRKIRYEKFCRQALSLNISISYPVDIPVK